MSAAQLTQQICCGLLTPAVSVTFFLYGFLMPARACEDRPSEGKKIADF